MMTRAMKAFPGVVFSMLLATPALASSHKAAHHERHEEPAPPRRVADGRIADGGETRRSSAHRATISRGLGQSFARLSREGGRVTAATRARRLARGGERGTERAASGGAPGLSQTTLSHATLPDATLSDATLWTRTARPRAEAGHTDDWADRIAPPEPEYGVGHGAGHGAGHAAGHDSAHAAAGPDGHPHIIQVGIASWYGGARWQGHAMSSGGRYDEAALTAAHATLPLGSKVMVALQGSARWVLVTITDRPGTRKRIIDLSRAAAAELGILDRGVAQVQLAMAPM